MCITKSESGFARWPTLIFKASMPAVRVTTLISSFYTSRAVANVGFKYPYQMCEWPCWFLVSTPSVRVVTLFQVSIPTVCAGANVSFKSPYQLCVRVPTLVSSLHTNCACGCQRWFQVSIPNMRVTMLISTFRTKCASDRVDFKFPYQNMQALKLNFLSVSDSWRVCSWHIDHGHLRELMQCRFVRSPCTALHTDLCPPSGRGGDMLYS